MKKGYQRHHTYIIVESDEKVAGNSVSEDRDKNWTDLDRDEDPGRPKVINKDVKETPAQEIELLRTEN